MAFENVLILKENDEKYVL